MKKKLCALVLALCVASTSVPMTAFAEETALPTNAEQEAVVESDADTEQKAVVESDADAEQKAVAESDTEPEQKTKVEDVTDESAEDLETVGGSETETENKEEDTAGEAVTENEEEVSEESEASEVSGEAEQEIADLIQNRTGSLEEIKSYELSETALDGVEVLDEQELESQTTNYGSSVYNSSWDVYSSNYIYNRLNSAEKAFWDALDVICNRYLTQSIDAQVYTVDIKEAGIVVGHEEIAGAAYAADCAYVGMSRASEIFTMFNYSNPQYYFLEGYLYSGTQIIPYFYIDFQTASKRNIATSAIKQQVNTWESQIAAGTSEVAKAKIAHDLIINKVMYDYGWYEGEDSMKNPFHQSAYSVFISAGNIASGEAGYTVCAGYSKAFEMLMNGAGVDTMAVTSSDHAWNIININDSWYYIDCTWDDTDGLNGQPAIIYDFFNRSRSKLLSLSGGQQESHVEESCYSGLIPACTLDSGATSTSIGTCYTPTTRAASPAISFKAVNGGVRVTMSTATAGADIYYTLNGTNPSSSYTRSYHYTGPFTVATSATIKALAVCNKCYDSGVSTVTTNGKSCKVTFKSNGGSSVSAQYVLYNAKASKPKNPTKSGYTFAGWYTDSKCTKAYNFSTKLTGNKTLYAKWLKKYTVKFNANSGSVKTKSMKVTYSKKYGTLPSPKRKGYSFTGWYTKKSGGTKITSTSKVKIKKTTTLYAHWKKVSVKTTAISKLQNVKGKNLQVTIKKVSGAAGYQVRYATNSSMKSAKTVTVKKSTKATISKLKKGKKYYVQVRAYKTDSAGKKVYGSWSKTKNIKIKR